MSEQNLFSTVCANKITCFPLDENTVQLWIVSLAQPEYLYREFSKLLSSSEHDRAKKFKFQEHRRRFVIAHGAMRFILAQYLKISPRSLEFSTGTNGKPKLAGRAGEKSIGFNLSHSYEKALLAVVKGREIGVDIEYIKDDYSFDEVAARFFSHREILALRALPEHLKREAFFKCWSIKEAFLKAKGLGLSGNFDELEISVTDDNHVHITANVPGWMLSELPPLVNYEAALVVEGDILPTTLYQWE